jgi:hypothetical protein
MKPQNRINNPLTIDENLIEKELQAGKYVIIQFVDKSYDDHILEHLNDLCLKYDENFSIRFYGHYHKSFDCKTVLKIPNVKWLSVDCLMRADNISELSELKNLRKLNLGIYELRETEILDSVNFKNLIELSVTDTKTKAINLEYLKEYKNLEVLLVSGHSKNIDSIGELSKLKTLYLNSISKKPVHFVNKLKNLKNLHFISGGRENINEIDENEIENLEVVWVRGFNNLDNISNFNKLKTLKIEDQIQLTKIDFDKELEDLYELNIFNCKKLSTLTGLKNLSALNTLVVSRTRIDFDHFIQQELPQNLKHFRFYTTKVKIDAGIKKTLIEKGYIFL